MTRLEISVMDDTLERLILSGIVGVAAVSKNGNTYKSARVNSYGVMEIHNQSPTGSITVEIKDLTAQKIHIQKMFRLREVSIWSSSFDLEKLWD